jgi:general secretion pathway protein D
VPAHVALAISGERASSGGQAEETLNEGAKPDFDSLIRLLQSTVAPESWKAAGGPGVVEWFPTNLSLIVRQSAEVHQKIADLLAELRRLHGVQVTLETRVIGLTDNGLAQMRADFDFDLAEASDSRIAGHAKHGRAVLTDAAAQRFLQTVKQQGRDRLFQGPKVTLFNGQSAALHLGRGQSSYALLLYPVVSPDRKSVQLSCQFGAAAYEMKSTDAPLQVSTAGWRPLPPDQMKSVDNQSTVEIADGQSLLIDTHGGLKPDDFGWSNETGIPILTKLPYTHKLFRNAPEYRTTNLCILVTPKIIVVEEEAQSVSPTPPAGE